MKLMRLQIHDPNSLFKDIDISFDDEWELTVVGDGLHCKRTDVKRLPRTFYSTSGKPSPVDAVTAVIGNNGSGKTTLARALKQINSSGKADFDYTLIFRGNESGILQGGRDSWLVLCGKRGETGHNCRSAAIKEDDSYLSPLKNLPIWTFENMVDYIYYSPHFTTENPFAHTEGNVINLSTTGLFAESQLGYYKMMDLAPRKVENMDLGTIALDERRRMFEFAAEFYKCRGDKQKDIPFPMPVKVVFDVDNISIQRFRSYFSHKRMELMERQKALSNIDGSDNGYNELLATNKRIENIINSLPNQFLAASIIICYVVACACDGNLLNGRHGEEKGYPFIYRLLDICDELLKEKLPDDNQEQDQIVLQKFCAGMIESINDAEKHLKKLHSRLTNERAALRFFLRLRKLLCVCPPAYGSVNTQTVIDLSNGRAFQLLRSVCRYHRQAMLFSPFIKLDFAPKMSSGEVSYLSLYGRLASYFVYWKEVFQSDTPKRDVIVFVDEAETTLHPDWQRKLLRNILWFFEQFAQGKHIHLILATHSPMLLSDIPLSNCVFLVRDDKKNVSSARALSRKDKANALKRENTFASNIFDLYRNSFFLKDGIVGSFAQHKIDAVMQKIRQNLVSGKKKNISNDEWAITEQIGDPLVRRYFENIRPVVSVPNRK